MSKNRWPDKPEIPLWLWLVIYAIGLGVIGAATAGTGVIGDGNDDDGCSSIISAHQGCFP